MKNAHSIYWYLWWGLSIEHLNDLVTEASRKKDFERVKLLCKVIALKSMGTTAEDFWIKNIAGAATKSLVEENAVSNY